MHDTDEAAEQAVAIDVAGEDGDAPPRKRPPLFPIGACLRVEPVAQEAVVEAGVRLLVGVTEEAEEGFVAREMLDGRELQAQERHMRRVEIDRRDGRRGGREITHDVAAAGRDGHDPLAGTEFQGCDVDLGIFPDLGVDETGKGEREQALQHAPAARERIGVDGFVENVVAHRPSGSAPAFQSRGRLRDRALESELRDGTTTPCPERAGDFSGIGSASAW